MTPQRIDRLGVAAVVAVVVLQTLLHLVNRVAGLSGRLDVNGERTLFSVLSGAVLLAAACGALLARRRARGRPRDGLLYAAAVMAFFAVDEVLALHERAGVRAAAALGLSEAWDSVLWPAVYLPLAASLILALCYAVRHRPSPVRGRMHQGLSLLVAAVALEVASAPFSTADTHTGLVHALEGAVEEALELGGWGLVALSLFAWAAQQQMPAPALAREAPRAGLHRR